ncbi:MAG: hypothetical protein ACJ790_08995 [Myxococcaceae bacterium]
MIRTSALLAVIVFLAPALAHAGKPLDDAQAAFDALSLDEAGPLFERALDEPGTREERIKAWRGLGLSRAFMGDVPGAKAAFEKLLIIDPDAKVETSLGPKIAKPFDAAKKAMRGKRSTISLTRQNRTGLLTVSLTESVPWASSVRLGWRLKGEKEFKVTESKVDHALEVGTPPDEDVEAWAEALDSASGVLFQDGSETAFKSIPAVVRKVAPVAAVTSAVEDAKRQADGKPEPEEVASSSEGSGSSVPYVLGGAVLVLGGGAAAAYLLSRPPELKLAPADRTGQLP